MKALICVTLAAAVAAGCPLLQAASATDPTATDSAHAVSAAAIRARLAKMEQQRLKAHAATVAGTDSIEEAGGSGPRTANAFRSYPPSCLADPLPSSPGTLPADSFQMQLYTRDDNGNTLTPETVNITIWRVPCSSSGQAEPYNSDGGFNSALLMRIDRIGTNEGHEDFYPTFPLLTATQDGNTNLVRGAVEPNTVIADGPFDSPIINSTTYVLENYPFVDSGYTNFNLANTLIIDPVIGGVGTSAVSDALPDYGPTSSTYPTAFQDLPIDGFLSSAWYDTSHGGEGIMVQIYDNPDGATRTLFAAWYTYDTNGVPFWISIQGVASYGAKSFANVPVSYYTGGGFAGNFSSVTPNTWGTMNISFPDCQHMTFDYNGNADAVSGPSGSGSLTFTRLADINGLNCE